MKIENHVNSRQMKKDSNKRLWSDKERTIAAAMNAINGVEIYVIKRIADVIPEARKMMVQAVMKKKANEEEKARKADLEKQKERDDYVSALKFMGVPDDQIFINDTMFEGN